MPPASRATFQPRPKSERLIFVVATAPRRVEPHGSFCSPVISSTVSRTLRVTPWMVRSPVRARPSPWAFAPVDLKVSVGNFSTSKKSALRRCASRFSSLVLMDAASRDTSTDAAAGFASS